MSLSAVGAGRPALDKGFSLVEVLVALVIVSVALAAFARTGLHSTDNVEHLEQKSLAMLSARNALAQWQAGVRPLKPGADSQPCPQAGWRFVCHSQLRPAAPGLLFLTIHVDAQQPERRRLVTLQMQLAREASP